MQQAHLHTTETFAYSGDICIQQGNREMGRSGIFDKCIKLKWSHILLLCVFLGYKLTQNHNYMKVIKMNRGDSVKLDQGATRL